MPLTNDNDDTFPMGLEIDFSSIKQIKNGETETKKAIAKSVVFYQVL